MTPPSSTAGSDGFSDGGRTRRRSVPGRCVAALLVTVAGSAALAGIASGAGSDGRLAAARVTLGNRTDPSASMAPTAAFSKYCFTIGHTAPCNTAAVVNIDRGRRAEHLRKLHLPRGFWGMNQRAQLKLLANYERSVRHLPSLGANTSLDRLAQAGAVKGDDPIGPSGYTWGSNISWGYATPLAADFGWMYDDGPKSPNINCPSPGAAGCWGHRHNILAPWAGAQGSGSYDNRGQEQLTQLFVESY